MQAKYRAIIFIIISAMSFAFMNLFVRMAGDLPLMQKVFFRNVVAFAVTSVCLAARPSRFKTAKGNFFPILMRAVIGTIGVVCNFYAVDNIAIADASMLNKLSPFFALVFSIFILKEKPMLPDWIAVGLALCGTVFVVHPGFTSNILPSLIGVAGGAAAGLAYTFLRKATMGGADRLLVVFCFSGCSCLVSLPFMVANYVSMTGMQVLYLLLAGVAATFGQIFITLAYSKAAAKDVSVFDYTIIIFSGLLAFGFLGELPEPISYVGYALIIVAAIFKWYMSRRKDKMEKLTDISS